MFQLFTDAKFVWFTINYRMWPDHLYPAAEEDLVSAIRFVKAHAAEFHADPRRLVITGESVGGHMVAWVGVSAVVPFYPPTDTEALAFGADQTPPAGSSPTRSRSSCRSA